MGDILPAESLYEHVLASIEHQIYGLLCIRKVILISNLVSLYYYNSKDFFGGLGSPKTFAVDNAKAYCSCTLKKCC
jgi:hypothetical protein